MNLVFLGLSLSSSWGNGHATTYRALLRGLAQRGHSVLFLERDVPWYASARDMAHPDFCELALYDDLNQLPARFGARIGAADAVIVGSYVPDGIAVLDFVAAAAGGVRAFYDLDTPVTVKALEHGNCSYLAISQVPTLDLYLSFTGGALLDRLAQRFGARRPCALYCAVDTTLYHPLATPSRWDLGYLGTYAADRQPALERLLIEPARRLRHQRFVVAGPQYPLSIEWPQNVERIEHLAPSEHVKFYSQQRFTLNITRADMVRTGWSPSVRIFEAGACGTPIISDRWDGLRELLPDIAIADDAGDVVDMLENTDDAARCRRGEDLREAILRGHTGTVRAAELEDFIQTVQGASLCQRAAE